MAQKAYRYHRFSTKRQDTGSSLDRQDEATKALCESKGWEVVATWEDKGRSAWKGDHLRVGRLGEFKDQVDQGYIGAGSILVIENLDRLSRQDVKFARRWLEDVTDKGITVAVCKPELMLDEAALSGSNIVSVLQYLLEANRSNKESERKSHLQKGAIERFMKKAREGIVYSARRPAWLDGAKDGKFRVIEERAAIVNQIYEWSAAGLGMYAITKKLNESIEPWTKPHKATKATWKSGYVRDILTSPTVEGEYHVKTGPDRKPTGEIIRNYYPRIVEPELVQRARSAQARRRGVTGIRHSEARNLFAGRIKCGHCGDTMIRQQQRSHGREYEYLKCIRFNNGAGCINTTLYRYDHFEKAALEEILHLALDSTHFVKTDLTGPLFAQLAQLNKDVEDLEGEQRRLLGFIRKFDDATEAEEELDRIRPLLTDLRVKRDETADALERAKGNVSPEEHLQRVMEVSNAIYSDDAEARDQARRRVRDAIQSVVQVVQCRRDLPDPTVRPVRKTPIRQIIMTLAGGYMAYLFDNEGNLLDKVAFEGDKRLPAMLAGTGAEEAVEAIRRRRAS